MYLWVKALHVIAIIAWMAGLLYLPRLFVYHSSVGPGAQSEIFKVMERRLSKFIMTPAMVAAWVAGIILIVSGNFQHQIWLHVKISLVIVLTFLHLYFVYLVRIFAADGNRHPQRFFRMINEVPTLIMIAVVILVIVKPF
jgi:putative membrane protein